jgi:4-amino-4-deoxy-L-arabinose transferase-like glycosyltransferase
VISPEDIPGKRPISAMTSADVKDVEVKDVTERSAVYVPERPRSERFVVGAVFLLSVAYLCLFRRYTAMEPDEGIVLQGAERILQGQVLYRDFFSFLTPGSFYLQALLFKLFGNSFLVARTTLAIFGGLFSSIGYLLVRRVCSRRIALLSVALVLLTTLPYRFLVLHNWDSSLFACLTVYSAIRVLESRTSIWAFALGSSAALTMLFEQSKGVGLGLGLGLGFAVLYLGDRRRFGISRAATGYIAVGLAWPFLITFGYFFSQHSLHPMLTDWLWPLQHYSTANHVRYGYQNWSESTRHTLLGTGTWSLRLFNAFVLSPSFLVPVLPLVAVALFFYWTYELLWKRVSQAKLAYYVVITGALSGILLSIVVVRADIIHLMYLQPLYGILLAWIFDGRDIPGRLFKAAHPVLTTILVLAFLAFAVPLLLRALNTPYYTETRRGAIATPAQDTVVEYVQSQVAPGSTMLVYPYLPLYSYFTATFNPAGYDFFQPGMNTAEQSRTILEELRSARVPGVLFEISFAQKIPSSWPGTPLGAIVRDPVADYIVHNYRTCRILQSPEKWKFLFMVRKETACPL